MAQRVKDLFGVDCQFQCHGEVAPLQSPVAAHLYKISQEALSNAIKHGKARQIVLRLAQERRGLLLSISNDGLPFRAESSQNRRMGMRIMNYRAHIIGGLLEIKTDEKTGTVVMCSLPLTGDVPSVEKGAMATAD